VTGGWSLVVLVGAATIAIKAAGPLVLGGRALPRHLLSALALLAPALFGALIATQVFARGSALTVDARVGGLLTAIVCTYLRAPATIAILLAAGVTAVLRLIF
jgi:branched-subunit amino acid transport protein